MVLWEIRPLTRFPPGRSASSSPIMSELHSHKNLVGGECESDILGDVEFL